MRLLVVLAALLAAATTATADNSTSSEIPSCALPCLLEGLTEINCGPIDNACICAHAEQMSRATVGCLMRSCTMEQTMALARRQAAMCNQPAESRQRFLLDMTIGCFSVQCCFIMLKFFTRAWIQRRLALDDWILLVAIISPLVGSAVLFWTINLGLGEHMWQLPASNIEPILGGFLVSEATYPWTLGLVRISLLVFLMQTFPDKRFQVMVKLLIAYTICHTLAFFFAVIFQCNPVPYAWDKTREGTCVNLTALTYAAAVLSGLLDVATGLLPLNELRKLQMSLDKKLSVIFIFVIGSCGCLAGFIRVKEIGGFSNNLDSDPDITWNYVNITYWTEIEITAMILCTCIPSLRPLLRVLLSGLFKGLYTKTSSSSPSTGPGAQETKNSAAPGKWQRLLIVPKTSDDGLYSLQSVKESRLSGAHREATMTATSTYSSASSEDLEQAEEVQPTSLSLPSPTFTMPSPAYLATFPRQDPEPEEAQAQAPRHSPIPVQLDARVLRRTSEVVLRPMPSPVYAAKYQPRASEDVARPLPPSPHIAWFQQPRTQEGQQRQQYQQSGLSSPKTTYVAGLQRPERPRTGQTGLSSPTHVAMCFQRPGAGQAAGLDG